MEPNAPPTELSDDEVMLESLPKEVGVFLVLIGVGGILLPGPVGAPLVVLGGVVLFPKVFRKVEQGMKHRFPEFHKQGIKQIRRFVDDLERRYPDSSQPMGQFGAKPGTID